MKSFDKANDIFLNILFKNISDNGDRFEIISDEGIKAIYEMFESTIISVVFSFLSIEILVNNLIPNNCIFLQKDKGKNKILVLRKHEIEFRFDIIFKIKNLIPRIYNCDLNLGKEQFWEDFLRLKKYRDELVHLKSQKISLNDNKSELTIKIIEMFENLINKEVIKSSKTLIRHLRDKIGVVPGFPKEYIGDTLQYEEYINHFGFDKVNIKIPTDLDNNVNSLQIIEEICRINNLILINDL
ncbi:MAG: hypothetical protein AB2L26_06980 [Ignavibacteria bacterium]